MKKIMLYAYTKGNLGDDLFVKILCDRYKEDNIKFYLNTSTEYTSSLEDIKNLKIVSRENSLIKLINYPFIKLRLSHNFVKRAMALFSDASIYIGGSLYMQSEIWKTTIEYHRGMKVKNQPFFLLGINFGPFYNEEYLIEHKKIFNEYNDVCVRDTKSFQLLQGVENLRYAPDIVGVLDISKYYERKEKYIIISLINLKNRSGINHYLEEYEEWLAQVSKVFINNGYRVYLMSFCEFEEDNEAIGRILKRNYKMANNLEAIYYKGNLTEALKRLANASLIIATRFHAMILGIKFKVPTLPIIYSEKMSNVIEDMNFKGPVLTFDTLNNLSYSEILKLVGTELNYEDYFQKAEQQFLKLDDFFRKEK